MKKNISFFFASRRPRVSHPKPTADLRFDGAHHLGQCDAAAPIRRIAVMFEIAHRLELAPAHRQRPGQGFIQDVANKN